MAQSRARAVAAMAPQAGALYEYLTYYSGTKPTHGQEATDKLNELGMQGYLLVAVGIDTMYFARVAAPPEPPPTNPPVNRDVPYLSGDAAVGGTLNCTMGNWDNEPTSYAYAWSGMGTATDNTYLVGAEDAGHSITCVVTATNVVGSTVAPDSNAVIIPGARR